MAVIDLGSKEKWKITKDELDGHSPDDYISLRLIHDGHILLKIKHIIDRYEHGVGNDGEPSVDWQTNGKHESYTGKTEIPDWIKKLMISGNSNFADNFVLNNNNTSITYSIRENFSMEDKVDHPTFGEGVVIARTDDKVSIIFKDAQVKQLVHNK